MKTITIADPTEVKQLLDEAFPRALYNSASFEPGLNCNRWTLAHCSAIYKKCPTFYGYGSTPEEALTALKAEVTNHDPLKEAREKLEAAGFTVAPA